MSGVRADIRKVVLSSSPLLALAALGPARIAMGWPAIFLGWALVTGAALLTFVRPDASSPAAKRWSLWLWLFATPALGFMREGPDPAAGGGLLLASAGFAVAARDDRSSARAAAGAALGALLGLALALGSTRGNAPVAPEPGVALFSSRHGLLFHWPVVWAGLVGLAPLARRSRPQAAASAAGLLIVLAAAACFPGARPATSLLVLPFIAPGLTACLEGLRRMVAAHPMVPLSAGAAVLVVWNMLFMQQYRDEKVPRDDTVSFAEVAEGNTRLWAERFGSPVAWPANWLLALRRRVSPDRFDLMVGKDVPERGGRRELDVGRLDLDESLLAEGWSVRHACGPAICRAVQGRARLFLPLPEKDWGTLIVVAGGEGRLGVRVNGRPLGWLPLAAGAEARLPLPPDLLRRGLNEIVLEAPDGPLLVDRLAVARGGG